MCKYPNRERRVNSLSLDCPDFVIKVKICKKYFTLNNISDLRYSILRERSQITIGNTIIKISGEFLKSYAL